MPDKATNQSVIPYIEWFEKPAKPSGLAMLLISGGAYKCCCDGVWIDSIAKYLTEQHGIQCIRLIYRTPHPEGMLFYQTAWDDGVRAVRMVRAEAGKRGFDPDKIGAYGISAGGHLVGLLAANSLTPPYSPIDSLDATVSCSLNFGITMYMGYSCKFNYDSKTPPMCIFHGGADQIVSPQISTGFYEELHARNIPAEIHLYADGDHGFITYPLPGHGRQEYLDRIGEWLHQMEFAEKLPPAESFSVQVDETSTLRRERESVWSAASPMPCPSPNQNYEPYIEWFEPKERKTDAVVISAPGGGYVNCNEQIEGEDVARWFNARGMTVVVLKYRTPRPIGQKMYFTAKLDMERTVRLVRSQCHRRGLNPDRIGIIGFSAGGHLCMLQSVSSRRDFREFEVEKYNSPYDEIDELSSKVNFAIPVYPWKLFDNGHFNEEFEFDPDSPRMCFIHSDGDKDASPLGSLESWKKLRHIGIQCDLHIFAKNNHGCFAYSIQKGTGAYNWLHIVWQWMKYEKLA